MITIILIFLIIIINFNFIYNYFMNNIFKKSEMFSDSSIKLIDYENFPIDNNHIYTDVYDLIEKNPNIKTDNNILIYFVNWDTTSNIKLDIS